MSPEQRTVALVLVGVIIVGWAWAYVRDNILFWSGATDLTKEAQARPVIAVHVTGAVRTPGVYRLPKGARVEDAISIAGGIIPTADLESLNLAGLLSDGQRVNIPARPPDGPETPTPGEAAGDQKGKSTPGSGRAGPGADAPGRDPRVNVNAATAQELEALPGIGPEIARRIIEYRHANGSFASVEDLRKVSGIGDRVFTRLKPLIRVR
jgi:competence protein ComEA